MADRRQVSPKRAWLAMFALLLAQAAAMGVHQYGFTMMALPWAKTFEVTRGTIALAPFAAMIGGALSVPLVGWMLDRWAGRVSIVGGLLLLAAAMLLTGISTRFWHLLLIQALMFGLAIHLAGSLAAQALVVKWFASRQGAALTLVSLGPSIGGLSIPPIMGLLLNEYGWRATYFWLAGGVIVLVPFTLLALMPAQGELALTETSPGAVASGHRSGSTAGWTGYRLILMDIGFWRVALSVVALCIAYVGIQHSLGAYAHDRGLSVTQASLLVSILAGSAMASKLLWVVLLDRVRDRGFYTVAAGSMILGALIIRSGTSFSVIAIGVAFMGIAGGGVGPYMTLAASRRFGVERIGRALGMIYIVVQFSVLGAPIAGWLFDLTREYQTAFGGFAILLALSLACILLFPESKSPTAEPAAAPDLAIPKRRSQNGDAMSANDRAAV